MLARDWTRGQHKRVIISFFTLWLFLMIMMNRTGMDNGTTEWHDTVMTGIDYCTIGFLEL